MSGTVLRAGSRTCTLTGQEFTVATLRTHGFAADLCLPGHMSAPAPGSIICGTVYLTAAFEEPDQAARRYV
jgi:hypothetical protein